MSYLRAISRAPLSLQMILILLAAYSPADDAATVYLTAKDTSYRLTKTAELTWTNLPQPSEGKRSYSLTQQILPNYSGNWGCAYRCRR